MNKSASTTTRRVSEKTWLTILMILTLVTMAVHLYLSLQHYQLKLGLSQSPAVCNVSSTFNCDAVGISRFATLFGMPMALLGLITQGVFLIYLVAVRYNLSSSTNHLRRFLFWFSLFVFGVSLVMGFFSSFYLGTYCLFCIAVYVLSLIQLGAAWKVQDSSPLKHVGEDIKEFVSASKWILILALLIPAFGWVGNSVILDSYGFGRINLLIRDSLAQWESEPLQNFNKDLGLSVSRSQEPTFTIVEFADFLCPHCKTASPTLEAFTQAHPEAQLIFKVFPLDGKCNKALQREGDGLRCRLSAAVFCAQSLNQKGWDAHHWIFERQEKFAGGLDFNQALSEMGQALGLDLEKIKTCLDSDATHEAILAQANEGAQAKIQGTPTIFVNGKMLPAGQFLPVMEALFQKLKP